MRVNFHRQDNTYTGVLLTAITMPDVAALMQLNQEMLGTNITPEWQTKFPPGVVRSLNTDAEVSLFVNFAPPSFWPPKKPRATKKRKSKRKKS